MEKMLALWKRAESIVYIGIGVTLLIAALGALVQIWLVYFAPWLTRFSTASFDALAILDQLLVVSMLGEILQMVKISLTQRRMFSEPFLVVGLISVVRRIIIITAESNRFMEQHEGRFTLFMGELVVLGALLVVLVYGIHTLRKQRLEEARRLRQERREYPDTPKLQDVLTGQG
jgi:uncharacterized membrane protein (DUF373 family)